jgi:hypothetical protein
MVLAAWASSLGGAHLSPFLGYLPAYDPLSFLIGFLIVVPICVVVFSIPTWIASKIVVSGSATYGSALKVQTLYLVAGFLLGLVRNGFALVASASPGGSDSTVLAVGMVVGLIAMEVFIAAWVYDIGRWQALVLNLLSGFFVCVVCLVVFLACAAVVGMSNAKAPLEASVQKIQAAQESGALPLLIPSPSIPAASPDYAGEIDGLLETALHHRGAPLSLTEREAIVRQLQEKLQITRNNLQLSDAHAVAGYQNRLNRYLPLLEAVKAERRAQTMRESTAARQGTPRVLPP